MQLIYSELGLVGNLQKVKAQQGKRRDGWMIGWPCQRRAIPQVRQKGIETVSSAGEQGRTESQPRKSKAPLCSFGTLLGVHYQHAMANCWKRQIPNDNKRQRFWDFWNKDPHKELKQDKYCHKDIGTTLKKLTLPPSCAEQHQVIRPFLHVSIIPSWGLITKVRAPEKSRASENQYTSVVERAWSKHLIATHNTSIRNSRELQCPSWHEPVKLYILATKAFSFYWPGNWSTRRFQPTFLNVEVLNQMSKKLAGMLERVSVFPRCFMSPLLLTE